MLVISSSYGNDSVACIQWAWENALDLDDDIVVAFSDTGWAAPGWIEQRVPLGEAFAHARGFRTVRLQSMGMEELVKMKKGWPGNGQQFCTAHLKGVPFLQWIDEEDKERKATIVIGKRRVESKKRADTPEFIEVSEYHGDRRLWHPLFLHTDGDRNALLHRGGLVPLPDHLIGDLTYENHDRLYILPHRSDECNPCVNANRGDLLRMSSGALARVSKIEVHIGKPMFRPKRFNGVGIYGVMMWAKFGKNHEAEIPDDEGCGAAFGCEVSK